MAWFRIDVQFQAPLFCQVTERLLEPLAYQFVHLVAGLSVYSPRRQSRLEMVHLPKPDADDVARRIVARSRLDLCNLGASFMGSGW